MCQYHSYSVVKEDLCLIKESRINDPAYLFWATKKDYNHSLMWMKFLCLPEETEAESEWMILSVLVKIKSGS